MSCAVGDSHTVTLSDDGRIYAFGNNDFGQLGNEKDKDITHAVLPTPISIASKITQISCGCYFTVCIDEEGFIWSFGSNYQGQLGTDKLEACFIPKKIEEIPLAHYVSCGSYYTLVITNDLKLWSFGSNDYGQLCNGEKYTRQDKPKETSFSNVSMIYTGGFHSFIQINTGDYYVCGQNQYGQLGIGNFDIQIKPLQICTKTFNNIVEFSCGYFHSLYLDIEGNVFATGYNVYGNLGLDTFANKNTWHQVLNIPLIKKISTIGHSSFLVDFEGNLWSFGYNLDGQLGHGDKTNYCVPKQTPISDIQQISYGGCGKHFLAKDSQNTIFTWGKNSHGQLGNTKGVIPFDPNKDLIWGDPTSRIRAKSARK